MMVEGGSLSVVPGKAPVRSKDWSQPLTSSPNRTRDEEPSSHSGLRSAKSEGTPFLSRVARKVEWQPFARLRAREALLQVHVQLTQRFLRRWRNVRLEPSLRRLRRLERCSLQAGVPGKLFRVALQQLEVQIAGIIEAEQLEKQLRPLLLPCHTIDNFVPHLVKVVERLLCPATLLKELVLVHQHLGVLIWLPRWLVGALKGLLVRLHDTNCLAVPLQQVEGGREGKPVHPVGRFERQKLLPGLQEVRQQPELHLQHGEIPQDLDVVRVMAEGAPVALDRLHVVPVAAVEEAVDVPADL
eukprot:scaffold237646_cov31-Tisochrysis_lutea.AAC.1